MFHNKHKLADPNVQLDWIGSEEWRGWDAPINVVRGEALRQEALASLCGPQKEHGYLLPVAATLLREPNNPVDRNAIRVQVGDAHVGYIAQEFASQMSPEFDKAQCKSFTVAGVVRGGSFNAPNFGIHLWLDRRISAGPEFAIGESVRLHPAYEVPWRYSDEPTVSTDSNKKSSFMGAHSQQTRGASVGNEVPGIRTGGSEHGGRWSDFADEPLPKLIKAARAFLKDEQDPLERHYAFNVFEEALYKCRDAFPTALDEFDAVCQQHDGEMTAIRSALIRRFGGVPLLPTYRQMAIRKSKTGDHEASAYWCRRGLEVYGSNAIESEGTTDLRNRLDKLVSKLK